MCLLTSVSFLLLTVTLSFLLSVEKAHKAMRVFYADIVCAWVLDTLCFRQEYGRVQFAALCFIVLGSMVFTAMRLRNDNPSKPQDSTS